MRRLTVILISILCLLPFVTNAQSIDELWNRARQLRNEGHYRQAIELFQKIKSLDSSYSEDCDRLIEQIERLVKTSEQPVESHLNLSSHDVELPFVGGEALVDVSCEENVILKYSASWVIATLSDAGRIVIRCSNENTSSYPRSTSVKVVCGGKEEVIKVIQQGAPEYVRLEKSSLTFESHGGEQMVLIDSNCPWKIVSSPEWCVIDVNELGFNIIADKNNSVKDRIGQVSVASLSRNVVVTVMQKATDEYLSISQNELLFPAEGASLKIKVETNADVWSVEDFPRWLNVSRSGSDSLMVECGKNIPNGEIRTESIQIKTLRQVVGVRVSQEARFPDDVLFSESNIVSGRNVSVGFSASGKLPMIHTSVGGTFYGSVVDYSLGNPNENAVYENLYGYGIGIYADLRLYKNIFLQAGCEFIQYGYKNSFEQTTSTYIPYIASTYIKGDLMNSYEEKYSLMSLDLPILLSWRFKIDNTSHVHFFTGPSLSWGLKAQMRLSGNSYSKKMYIYDALTNEQLDRAPTDYLVNKTSVFNLYAKDAIVQTVYTEAAVDTTIDSNYSFLSPPYKRMNINLLVGLAYEISGLSVSLSYAAMLNNMANRDYWDNQRLALLNESPSTMSGYAQRVNFISLKLAYTLRY